MIISIIRNNPLRTAIPLILFSLIIFVFSLSFHEFSHALTAFALGDPTAKNRGRLSLNPLRHLNPIGFISMLLTGFGWAEPVPINPIRFKKRKLGMAMTAFAGPVSNIILSFLGLFLQYITWAISLKIDPSLEIATEYPVVLVLLFNFFYFFHLVNLQLALFNMIPVPPLDGSRIVSIFLPSHLYFKVMQYEKYIAVGLVILLYFGLLDGPLSYVVANISELMTELILKIPFLGIG